VTVLTAPARSSVADLPSRSGSKFAFGLWTVGHVGRDPFGEPTREPIVLEDFIRHLADIGAWGVTFHDDDLVPFGSSLAQRDAIVGRFKAVLAETGVVACTATTNLFTHPVFKDGAFTSSDQAVRRFAIQKVMRNLDTAAEVGATTYVFWGGREGVEAFAAKDPQVAFDRYREALDFLAAYSVDQGYNLRFALEPKPNEPRGDTFLPTVGHMLAFIDTLEHADMVGVNPEVAHETMAGLSFYHGVAQAMWQNKLFHIDLNAQKIGRFDQDLRFGSEGIKEAFFLVRLLESGGYDGPRHFDARPYRNEWGEGVWTFARGCMRTYELLAERARAFDADPLVADALAAAGADELRKSTVGTYSPQVAGSLREEIFDPQALAARGYYNEQLDQLVIEHILGSRP
jgi:xylose isomerase